MTSIDHLVDRLSRLSGATIGRGPDHPREPDPSIADRVTNFLDRYPALGRDTGYVTFMWKYAGASVYPPDESMFASILGFADGETNIEDDLEGPVIDDDGFLFFADWGYHTDLDGRLDSHGHSFLFDVSDSRRPGIHRYSWSSEVTERTWYAEDFGTWLGDFADGGPGWRDLLPRGR